MRLSDEHISYIDKDLKIRGIVDEDLGEELLDHICSLVETRMEKGERFIEAYEHVRGAFGAEKGLREIQNHKINHLQSNHFTMINNYIKIAIRNLMRHKFYSIINIAGLAVSVTCCIVIALYVIDELSYDQSFKDGDRVFRMARKGKFAENEFDYPTGPAPLAKALESELPTVELAVRMRNMGSGLVRAKDETESRKESMLVYADHGTLELFERDILFGSEDALANPNTAAISESAAIRYFGKKDAIDEVLIFDGDAEKTVGAVYRDFPEKAHIRPEFLISMLDHSRSNNTVWASNNNFFTYFKLKEGAGIEETMVQLRKLVIEKVTPEVKSFTGNTYEEFIAAGNYLEFYYQPLDEIYLNSNYVFDIAKTGNKQYVNLFIIIAGFILLLACINFMNLSTARSANRAREVGIRKVLGSFRRHLIRQFLMESILISVVSFLAALGILVLSLPFFNTIAGKQLSIPFAQWEFYVALIGMAMLVGILAGTYPAFFLSSFSPVKVLKGKLSLGSRNRVIRSGLVVFQFFISIALLIGTVVIYQQLDFIQNKNLGYKKDQVLMIYDTYMLDEKLEPFKNEINALPDVESSTLTGYIPINDYYRSDQTFWPSGKEPTSDNLVNMQFWSIDDQYFNTLGLELIRGRNFDSEKASDSSAVILNQKAFERYGMVEGEDNYIQTFGLNENSQVDANRTVSYRVIGVVEDFHFESMSQPIGPLGFYMGRDRGIMSIKLKTQNYPEAIQKVEGIWEELGRGLPFNYEFLDAEFQQMYESEQRLMKLFGIFSVLAIFIGCLGLFALASFMAEQRTREIGIRKVMGASVNGIIRMLSFDFLKLIVLSFVIAAPFSWWLISFWLENYQYRIDPGWETYTFPGLIGLVIAIITVGYQAWKAAASDPVKALKGEN